MIQQAPRKAEKNPQKPKLKWVKECLYKLEPYGKYYGQSRHHGKLFRESLKTTDIQLAKQRLKGFLDKVGKIKPGTGGITFEQVLDTWRKLDFETAQTRRGLSLKPRARAYREDCIKGLKREWPDLWGMPVKDIIDTECKKWFLKRQQKISAQLLNNELSTLRMVLERAIKEGIIAKNPTKDITRVTIPDKKPKIPTPDQFTKLISVLRESLNDNSADFVESLAYSGMRCAENAEILLADVDFLKGEFTVTGGENGTKNREERVVPLFPALRNLWIRIRDKNKLKQNDRLMVVHACKDVLRRACKKLNFPNFTHHHFRHFFASNAVEAGVDFKAIAGWLGHRDGGVLVAKTYSHLRDKHSHTMAAKMTFDASVNNRP